MTQHGQGTAGATKVKTLSSGSPGACGQDLASSTASLLCLILTASLKAPTPDTVTSGVETSA